MSDPATPRSPRPNDPARQSPKDRPERDSHTDDFPRERKEGQGGSSPRGDDDDLDPTPHRASEPLFDDN